MKSIAISKTGLVRQTNQDSFYEGDNLFIVADGMGGYHGGDIASELAIDTIKEHLLDLDEISQADIKKSILEANTKVWSKTKSNTELQGMGTTVVIASIDENNRLTWGNVGDSRLYICSDDKLVQLTTDHSLVQSLVDSGVLPEEERNTYPKRNYLTRAVGVESHIEVDTGTTQLKTGDTIILCSDGLSSYMSDADIYEVLRSKNDKKLVVEKLMETVYELGAKDNITIIIGIVE